MREGTLEDAVRASEARTLIPEDGVLRIVKEKLRKQGVKGV